MPFMQLSRYCHSLGYHYRKTILTWQTLVHTERHFGEVNSFYKKKGLGQNKQGVLPIKQPITYLSCSWPYTAFVKGYTLHMQKDRSQFEAPILVIGLDSRLNDHQWDYAAILTQLASRAIACFQLTKRKAGVVSGAAEVESRTFKSPLPIVSLARA